jgi:hypothetical protein
MANLLTPSFAYRFPAPVWKIRTDGPNGLLAIETRDSGTHTTAFSVMDFRLGKLLFSGKSIPDSWNYTLDEIGGGHVLMTGFLRKNSPERKGIIALNAQTGAISWEAHHLALQSVNENGLAVYNPSLSPKRLSFLTFYGQATNRAGLPREQEIILPRPAGEPAGSFLGDDGLAGQVLHASYNGFSIYAFHLRTETGFSQVLRIFSGEALIAEDFLDKGIQKLNPEAFFIVDGCLVSIRSGNEIVTYLL